MTNALQKFPSDYAHDEESGFTAVLTLQNYYTFEVKLVHDVLRYTFSLWNNCHVLAFEKSPALTS